MFNVSTHSMILKIVMVDDRRRVIDLEAGWPGSVNDRRIWDNSSLKRIHEEWLNQLPTTELTTFQFPDGVEMVEEVPAFILGDSAYPNTRHMVSTFRMSDIRGEEVIAELNQRLGSARYVVENAFGIMKQRFQLLKAPLECSHENVKYAIKLVVSMFVLHNFLIDVKDHLMGNLEAMPACRDPDGEGGDGEQVDDRIQLGETRTRDILKRHLQFTSSE